jgi:hypothetical protein
VNYPRRSEPRTRRSVSSTLTRAVSPCRPPSPARGGQRLAKVGQLQARDRYCGSTRAGSIQESRPHRLSQGQAAVAITIIPLISSIKPKSVRSVQLGLGLARARESQRDTVVAIGWSSRRMLGQELDGVTLVGAAGELEGFRAESAACLRSSGRCRYDADRRGGRWGMSDHGVREPPCVGDGRAVVRLAVSEQLLAEITYRGNAYLNQSITWGRKSPAVPEASRPSEGRYRWLLPICPR